ncbi:MAG: hypothetical protein PSV13_11645 [Lacunisphaera sp.]|nr:hypothetical protein [Lacunisphaera sp.]
MAWLDCPQFLGGQQILLPAQRRLRLDQKIQTYLRDKRYKD